jgi:hypothetical protein
MGIDADGFDCDGADRVDAASEISVGTDRIERLEGMPVDASLQSDRTVYLAVGLSHPGVGSSYVGHRLLGVDLDSNQEIDVEFGVTFTH